MHHLFDADRLLFLALRFASGSLTPEEDAELEQLLQEPEIRERFEGIISPEGFREELPLWEEAASREEGSLEKIDLELGPWYGRAKVRRLRRWSLVAAGVVGLAMSISLLKRYNREGHHSEQAAVALDLKPGGQKATLTLASGRQVVLDSVRNGRIDQEGGSEVEKVDSGVIAYSAVSSGVVEAGTGFNTLATPQGGTYAVRLPDGSEVVLNNASSLHYPTHFNGTGARVVELTGEAYFKIARDARRPFLVKAGGQQTVEVLGTEFDIKAYGDEPEIKTTLLSGSVRVEAGDQSVLLKPGEQAAQEGGRLQAIKDVDTAVVLAWKDGMFRWEGASLQEVMRDLGRWYNVQVVYDGPAPTQRLIMVVGRNRPASEVLKALEISGYGYHFKITGTDRIEVTL